MATVALNAAKSYYEEKHDRGSFVKDIISDNIMLGDIYMRAKELRVATDVSRGIFAIRALQKGESVPNGDHSGHVPGPSELTLSSASARGCGSDPPAAGRRGQQGAEQDCRPDRGGSGSTVKAPWWWAWAPSPWHLRDLAKSYKEAQIAIEVGKVFDTERYVINYENLGIGRLIYQLPTTLCEMFLQEVFKKNPIDAWIRRRCSPSISSSRTT